MDMHVNVADPRKRVEFHDCLLTHEGTFSPKDTD